MAKQIKVKITSAVSIDGKIIAPGRILDVDEPLAKNLLQRGRAELATAAGDDVADDNGSQAEAKGKAGDKK